MSTWLKTHGIATVPFYTSQGISLIVFLSPGLQIIITFVKGGLTNIQTWYGITNPSVVGLVNLGVNPFIPWRSMTSATDSGHLWCNYQAKKCQRPFKLQRDYFQVYQKQSSWKNLIIGSRYWFDWKPRKMPLWRYEGITILFDYRFITKA